MGFFYAICAYLLWGILPIFWKQLQEVPVFEVICHRMVWSFVFVALIISWKEGWSWLNFFRKNPKTLCYFLLSSSLLTLNWLTFVWAVNNGYIVEASLGYFINPLFSVFLGVFYFQEKMRRGQILAISIAGLGVLYLTFVYGKFPLISFFLASSFGIYSLIRKVSPLKSFQSLAVETSFFLIPGIYYISYKGFTGQGFFWQSDSETTFLLICTGIVTAAPLLFFAAAIKRIPLFLLGFIQYLAPSMQFLIGVFLYQENLVWTRLVGFLFIWTSIILFSWEAFFSHRQSKALEKK